MELKVPPLYSVCFTWQAPRNLGGVQKALINRKFQELVQDQIYISSCNSQYLQEPAWSVKPLKWRERESRIR